MCIPVQYVYSSAVCVFQYILSIIILYTVWWALYTLCGGPSIHCVVDVYSKTTLKVLNVCIAFH